ncbi:YkvI family membrane protein [Allosphingosinicella indica]|uniref:Uncharacterized membrane protein YkvI n=1 Tax=Allosphingosinicella indica TaxID=941907 RepID=A0A1X7GQ92_9SPHN|nr:hypothetical protein [Allosphingosinicella indica]SMF72355.1 Uncharacterized membrane protein YkvI [Allosphingosinicella indica]
MHAGADGTKSTWFQRFLLPGFAFKAVVIGGGYATGRELAEFFLPSGPAGGLLGLLLTTLIWSAVCAVAFAFARLVSAYDYRSFFKALLGPIWIAFEITYLLFLVLILAVVAAAAGEIGRALFGLPVIAGTLALVAAIAGITAFGNRGAENLFRYASTFIYLVYALFLILALASFGDRISPALASGVPTDGWVIGGMTYASYNVVAAVAVLPFLRHLTSRRDALVAGALAGPLAALPAIIFFLCMTAWYPAIGSETLPSDFLLRRIGQPWLHLIFQLMIFCALLETGVGAVNAVNERVDEALKGGFAPALRLTLSAALLLGSAFVAARIGLIDLIASGYGAFGYIMLALFVVPLLVLGTLRLVRANTDRLEREGQ